MPVLVPEKTTMPVVRRNNFIKVFPELQNGTLIGNGVGMRNGALVARLGDQHTSIVGIKGMTEYIEQKIPFPHKADTESITVFGF